MALISKIRRQKWLLVGSMAVALFLFIAMLMFDNPNQSLFGGSATTIGDIEGRKLDYKEFSVTHDMLYRNSGGDGFSDRTFLWNFFVDEAIIKKEAETIGLGVSKTELLDLQFGADNSRLSPIITNRYVDPNTRQVDRQQLDQLKNIITTNQIDELIQNGQLVPDFKYRWAHQEKEIINDRLQTKMANMVSKGMYTPAWMAEIISSDQNLRVDFNYVQVPFDEIENSEVTLEDADFKAYFDENKNQFNQDEETRKLEYAIFNVAPTPEDSAAISDNIANLTGDFEATEDDSLFVENNYGSIDAAYFKKETLSTAIADTIFQIPIGSVYGPYLDGSAYKAVKLLDKKVIPDSVEARHILRTANDQATLLAAIQTIDSLKNLIETGAASFDSLAANFSQDPSNASKGGDLGFFEQGRMVKEFNDACFFNAEPGKLQSVITQFGVHLIEVTDRGYSASREESVKVAYITQEIVPSQGTQDNIRELALQMQENNPTIEDLRKAAAEKGMDIETSPWLKKNDYASGSLSAGQGTREMIRWAFGVDPNVPKPDAGDISPQVYSFQGQGQFFINKFVVAALQSIRPAGMPSYKEVKDEIEPLVINRKKGEIIKQRLQGNTDLVAIASSFSTKVDTAMSISFASAFLPNAGNEPNVVAQAFNVDLNQLSEPIVGNSGVFVILPTNKPAPASGANIAQVRQSSQQSTRGLIKTRLMPAMRKKADITDNRSRFF
jgi:peptidyl-prolyl cis-trans isomerase D